MIEKKMREKNTCDVETAKNPQIFYSNKSQEKMGRCWKKKTILSHIALFAFLFFFTIFSVPGTRRQHSLRKIWIKLTDPGCKSV